MANLLVSYLYFSVFSGVESPVKRWRKILRVIRLDVKNNSAKVTKRDLENVHNWLRANKLTLNMTEFIIGSRQRRLSNLTDSPTITTDNVQISQVATAKSLGVTIDNKLDWSSHTDKLTKKIASGIGAMKRIRHFVPQATLHLIYQAIIQPHFDYCNVV